MTRFTQNSALLVALVTGSALLLTACGPSASTETKGQATLSIQGTSPSGTATRTATRTTAGTTVDLTVYDNTGAADGTLTLTKAWMVVKEIDMEKEDEVEDDGLETEVEIEFVGPFVVDLLTSTSSPELPALMMDAAFYDEIEMDIEKLGPNDLDASGAPLIDTYPELEHYSLYLEGTYTDQTASTYVNIPFTLKYDQTDEFEMSGAALGNGVALEAGSAANLLVAFRMARWFRFDDPGTNSDLLYTISDAIVSDGAGGYQLVLDGNTHSDIMDIVEDNIEDSADFGEDSDGDGELGSDEDEDDDDSLDDDSED